MHFSILVVNGDALLQTFGYRLVVYHYPLPARLGIHHKFENVQEFSPVPAALAEQGFGFNNLDVLFL